MQGIYIITCLANSKVYIGQSKNIKSRFSGHRRDLLHNKHTNTYLQRAWNKYGESAFVFSILEECSDDKLTEREQYWIDYYGGVNSDKNYNFKDAGSRGKVSKVTIKKLSDNAKKLRQDPEWVKRTSDALRASWTPERRQKMSDEKKGVKWTEKQRQNRKRFDDLRRGVSRPPEVGKKVSQTLKGHIVTEETREKIRQAAKKQIHKPLTEEQRKNVSEGAKRGWETRRKNGNKNCVKGCRLVNNGIVTKQVAPDEVEKYLASGYQLGKIKRVNIEEVK